MAQDSVIQTSMEMETFTFSWEVINYKLYSHPLITSRRFVAENIGNTGWYGQIHVRGFPELDTRDNPEHESEEIPEHMFFYLRRYSDDGPWTIELHCTLMLIGSNGDVVKYIEKTQNVEPSQSIVFFMLTNMREVENFYLNNDTLKVKCVLRKIKKWGTLKLCARSAGSVVKTCRKWALSDFSWAREEILSEFINVTEGGLSFFDVRISVEETPLGGAVKIEFASMGCKQSGKPMSLNVLITVLNSKLNGTDIRKRDRHVFGMQTDEVWLFPTFIYTSLVKKNYLVNDVLNLKCEIEVCLEIQTAIKHVEYRIKNDRIQAVDYFAQDMNDLFHSKRFEDVELRVAGETVQAHRIFLELRSEKFAKVLNSPERAERDLDVPDLDMVTLKRILKYMYTEEMEELEFDDVAKLYISAHAYAIKSLKCRCSFVLQSLLNVNNVCKVLSLSDDADDMDLNECAEKFIKEYWNIVSLSEEWKSLSEEKEMLTREISTSVGHQTA